MPSSVFLLRHLRLLRSGTSALTWESVQAAAETSPDPKQSLSIDYRELIGRLPRAECEDLLTRLAEGDPGIGLALRKRLGEFLPQERPQSAKPRTIEQLRQRAGQLEETEKKLEKIMVGIHKLCYETAEEYGAGSNYVLGANIAGFIKVAQAMVAHGLV